MSRVEYIVLTNFLERPSNLLSEENMREAVARISSWSQDEIAAYLYLNEGGDIREGDWVMEWRKLL